jgi:hypothetical protein
MKIKLIDIDLLVPCRSFSIEYSFTNKRQIPILSEYALRLCYELERLECSTLCDFFCLTDTEAIVLLGKLESESLVTLDGNSIELTPYCRKRFAEAGGDTSRFFEYKDDLAVVFMDLNHYHLFPPGTQIHFPTNYGIPIVGDDIRLDVTNKVISGFSRNYSYFLREYKSEESLSSQNELYKVGRVSTKKDGLVPLAAEILIDTRNYRLSSQITNADKYQNIDCGYLLDKLNQDFILGDPSVEQYEKSLIAHDNIFGDAFIREFIGDDNRFHLGKAFQAYLGKWIYPDESTITMIGYHYNDENILRLKSLTENVFSNVEPLDLYSSVPEGIMLLNSHSNLWGRSKQFSRFCEDIARAKFSLVGNFNRRDENKLKQFFYGFSRPIGLNQPIGSDSTFCLLVPGRFAIVQYYFPHPDTQWLRIPVGFATTNPINLDNICNLLRSNLCKSNLLNTGLALKHESEGLRPLELGRSILSWMEDRLAGTIAEGNQ